MTRSAACRQRRSAPEHLVLASGSGARTAVGVIVLALAGCASAPPSRSGADTSARMPVPAQPTVPPPVARSVQPAATVCPTPDYPEVARRAQATGTTVVGGDVQADGTVRSVVVVRSSGASRSHKLLDRAAAEALARCRFPAQPGTLAAPVSVDYVWKLE